MNINLMLCFPSYSWRPQVDYVGHLMASLWSCLKWQTKSFCWLVMIF